MPEESFGLFHELLNRELSMKIEGDRLRVVGPNGSKPELSESDAERIRRWKPHLMALVAYEPPERTF